VPYANLVYVSMYTHTYLYLNLRICIPPRPVYKEWSLFSTEFCFQTPLRTATLLPQPPVAAQGAPESLSKGGGLRSPPFGRLSAAPGAAQAPKSTN